MGFIIRWACAFVLLAATFNPTPYNYVTWAQRYGHMNLSIAVLLGLLLFIGYVIYLRATLRSIGGLGMLLVLALWIAVWRGNRRETDWLKSWNAQRKARREAEIAAESGGPGEPRGPWG